MSKAQSGLLSDLPWANSNHMGHPCKCSVYSTDDRQVMPQPKNSGLQSYNKSVTYRSITNKADQWSPSYIISNNHSADASVLCLSYLYKLKHFLSVADITLHMELRRQFIHHWNKNSTKFWRKNILQLWIDYLTVSNALWYKRLCLLQVEF